MLLRLWWIQRGERAALITEHLNPHGADSWKRHPVLLWTQISCGVSTACVRENFGLVTVPGINQAVLCRELSLCRIHATTNQARRGTSPRWLTSGGVRHVRTPLGHSKEPGSGRLTSGWSPVGSKTSSDFHGRRDLCFSIRDYQTRR